MGEFTGQVLEQALNTILGPDCYAILTDLTSFPAKPTIAQVVSAELINPNYERKAFNYQPATWDNAQNRAELPGVSLMYSLNANGTPFSFDTLVIISGTTALSSVAVNSIDYPNDRLTIADNPFVNGDPVVLTGGTIPLSLQGRLFVLSSTAASIQVTNSSNTPLDLSGLAAPIRVHNAKGEPVYIDTFPGGQQLLPGEAKTITEYVNLGRSNANVTAS